MALRIETFFSKADRDAIREATTEAERRTSGELVVYVTERCDPHPEVPWKGALLGGALGALCAALAVWRFGGWGAPDYPWILIGFQLGLVLGWIASRFDEVARRLIPEDALESRVDGRAAEAFLEEQVFSTAGRTGVLIFVALFEHRVLILADEGIDAQVAMARPPKLSFTPCIAAPTSSSSMACTRGTPKTSSPMSRGFAVNRLRPAFALAALWLIAATAALRRVETKAPPAAIGRSTVEAMQSGLVVGHAGLVDGIVERLVAEVDGAAEPAVVATGGLASTIVPHCRAVEIVDDRLTLDGLRLIYLMNTEE